MKAGDSVDKLEQTKILVRQAGDLIKGMMNDGFEINEKTSKTDLVTNVDQATERFLVKGINELFPGQTFLTEEKTVESVNSDDMWVIDPIDGTLNFIYQQENFSISVAYFHKMKPVFGIVYDVMQDKMYWAHVERGAYLNDVKLGTLDQSKVLADSMLTGDVYRPHFFKIQPAQFKPKFIAHRYVGSGAIETALIGSGKFQAYVFPEIKIWDIAAGLIILKMSGGTWLLGEEHDVFYFDDTPRTFLACSNDLIKNELIALL